MAGKVACHPLRSTCITLRLCIGSGGSKGVPPAHPPYGLQGDMGVPLETQLGSPRRHGSGASELPSNMQFTGPKADLAGC